MATVNFRVDEALKEKSYSILKEQGIAPTDFFTSILEYVATTGKLPVKKALLSEEDEELLALVRKRINDPKEMFEEVTLDAYKLLRHKDFTAEWENSLLLYEINLKRN